MAERIFDPAQIERFQRDGFLVVENVFDTREIAAFGAEVDTAVASRTIDAHLSKEEQLRLATRAEH